MEWHDSVEALLKSIGEECQIKAKIHRMMFEHYSKRNLKYQLPVIILSVLSGSGNFIASNFVFFAISINLNAFSILPL